MQTGQRRPARAGRMVGFPADPFEETDCEINRLVEGVSHGHGAICHLVRARRKRSVCLAAASCKFPCAETRNGSGKTLTPPVSFCSPHRPNPKTAMKRIAQPLQRFKRSQER